MYSILAPPQRPAFAEVVYAKERKQRDLAPNEGTALRPFRDVVREGVKDTGGKVESKRPYHL